MANYNIIGGDGKEYGPVTEADVRQWITEGRLNGESRVKAESDAEFRGLAQFPEFAAALQAQAPGIIAPPGRGAAPDADFARNAALQAIRSPAIALQVVAGLNVLLSLWSLIQLVFFNPAAKVEQQFAQVPQLQDPAIQKWIHLFYGPLGIGSDIFAIVMAALIFWGATQMLKLQNHVFAIVAALLAMLPCVSACCVLGLPFGIWALVVLNKTEIKSQFK